MNQCLAVSSLVVVAAIGAMFCAMQAGCSPEGAEGAEDPQAVAAEAPAPRVEYPVGGRNRAVRVATVSQDNIRTRGGEDRLDKTFERMEWATYKQPDIICLPEGFIGRTPEAVPGPTSERVGQFAREHNCYVIAPYHTLVGERHYNSAVLIDRQGAVVGQYNKAYPVYSSVQRGNTPGTLDVPVFDTDFGKIGMQICFDANWPKLWQRLEDKGAEIVFFPSAYPAHRDLAMYARLHQYYVVSSARTRASRIYDITGDVMAQSSMFQPWAEATLHLSKRLFELGGHKGWVRNAAKKYGRRISVKWYSDDDQFTLASLDPELAAEDVVEEFGLVPLREYIALQTEGVDAARPE